MSELHTRLLAGRLMFDVAAAQVALIAGAADRAGLFVRIHQRGDSTAAELATDCALPLPFVTHALTALHASGYVHHDGATDSYFLSPDQAAVFCSEESPFFLGAAFRLVTELAASRGSESGHEAAAAIGRLSTAKFPSLLRRRCHDFLAAASTIAEIGCGRGGTLLALAEIYPQSRFTGIDVDPTSIEYARTAAASQSLGDRVSFMHADELAQDSFDCVLLLEVVHEAAEPQLLLERSRALLRDGGTLLAIEPCRTTVTTNHELRYLASMACLYCLPASGYGPRTLGPLAAPQTYRDLLDEAGFVDVTIEEEGGMHVFLQATR